ncbi:MAG TPA: Flp pilus assembly complex ATPase component TadA [Actinobacteria bacterium]|jgi:type IV pilus assembly protein PilB|nr:Flp pilus assembly complex ATPase component TadA [Actinomycetota bacterium]
MIGEEFNNSKIKIGELLVKNNLITQSQLQEALEIQKKTGKKIGEILIEENYISEYEFKNFLSLQKGYKQINLSKISNEIDVKASNLISKEYALKMKVFPFKFENEMLAVATLDPLNIYLNDELRMLTGYEVEPYISTNKDIEVAIRTYMSDEHSLKEVEEITKDLDFSIEDDLAEDIDLQKNPLIRLANQIILKAIMMRASDIHIEPQEKHCLVRFRIDGILQVIREVPKTVQRLLISRYKIMSGMDITETRLPQDGRSSFNYHNRFIDLRFASLPSVFGENISIRILNREESIFNLQNLGMPEREMDVYGKVIKQPYGSVIITGPTGSGKTSTLYASLTQISTPEKKIYTVEDPVEYKFPHIMQVQVNQKIGMSFAASLRAMMRSDPDIIMIGEIRDYETAKIAVEASITGHLVLTTLHTNDAPSSVARLFEMGIEPYMIASALRCVVAQRLLRRLCPACKKEADMSNIVISDEVFSILKDKKIYEKTGCSQCNNTGYLGRVGIFSVLLVTPRIRKMILDKSGTDAIENQARQDGMRTLLESAAEKVADGITSLEEMYRVVF